ncbi:MAG TPA: SRPBCC family protein [Acidimicrobiia bacterium]|nr:SRPBCC family protein [Acidimicrobiia bacterium]
MLIKNSIEVDQPIDKVWEFCQDVPQVGACLPGAELNEELGPDQYAGKVGISMGPIKMQFSGTADVTERDEANKTIIIDAAGSDEKGQGQAALGLSVRLVPTAGGTRLEVEQDIQLSGAAAQYGRGMIGDVSQVLMRDFATNMQDRLDAFERGVAPDQMQQAQRVGGFTIGLKAAWMALKRVGRRFFLPYEPSRV